MAETPEVKPGQLWADNDKRSAGRRLRVNRVDETYAYCYGFYPAVDSGRPVRVRLDRFRPTSTGYRLVSDA